MMLTGKLPIASVRPAGAGRVGLGLGAVSGAALLLVSLAAVAGDSPVGDLPPPGEFRIQDGRVDAGTYTGWRLFHSACHVCHGVDATGTERAPDLVTAIDRMTPRTFARKVLGSYGLIASTDGKLSAVAADADPEKLDRVLEGIRGKDVEVTMPAWGEDKRVRPHVLDLYAYLTARAAGLPGGEPKVIGDP